MASPLHDYIAGSIGGCAGIVVGHPFDTTKVQLQTHVGRKAFHGATEAVKSINKYGMVHGFFRGMALPLASYGVVNGLFFGVYGNAYKYLSGKSSANGKDDPNHYRNVFLAGCLGGAVQLTVACPTDVVKVVLQSQMDGKSAKAVGGQFYHGPIDCLRGVYRTGGVRALYRGLLTFAYRDVPTFGLYMVTYEWLEKRIASLSFTDDSGVVSSFIAGGLAGMTNWSVVIPVDVIKSRLQSDPHRKLYRGIIHCAQLSYQQEGFRVFFSGAGVILMRAFVVNSITFLVYSKILSSLERSGDSNQSC